MSALTLLGVSASAAVQSWMVRWSCVIWRKLSARFMSSVAMASESLAGHSSSARVYPASSARTRRTHVEATSTRCCTRRTHVEATSTRCNPDAARHPSLRHGGGAHLTASSYCESL